MIGTTGDPYDALLHDLLLSMGKVQGTLEAIQLQQKNMTSWMAKLDDRLRRVERKAAINGMIGGGLVATGFSLLADLMKSKLTGG
ncbi:MAG: hypothetical protein HQL94_00040 [Magnetococcales bacterium]|nr:hypothetical protein [Magnetococcales bacterium]MBF0439774.1 hypothetical protein [Magnetococcales bacterium]